MANQSTKADDGFIAVTNDRSNYYFKKGKGAVIRGYLVGRFARNGGKGHFYQIELDEPAPTTFYNEETEQTQEVIAPIGMLVNVDETSALISLQPYAEAPRQWLVRIECVKKEKMHNGQTFWRMVVGRKLVPKVFSQADAIETAASEQG
jgi:hypothetical protein